MSDQHLCTDHELCPDCLLCQGCCGCAVSLSGALWRWWGWTCPDCAQAGRAKNKHDAVAARRKHRGRKHPERVRAEARVAS